MGVPWFDNRNVPLRLSDARGGLIGLCARDKRGAGGESGTRERRSNQWATVGLRGNEAITRCSN